MRVLVHAPSWVGDAVLAIPALEALRRRWPQAELVVLARDAVAELYGGQPFLDRAIGLGEAAAGSWRANERLAAQLRAERADVAISFANSFIAAWRLWRARAAERIGYRRDGRSWLLTRAVPPPRRGEVPRHHCYYYLELLRRSGLIETIEPVRAIRLVVADELRAAAERRLQQAGAGAPRVALAPGASYGPAKCWPPERFAAAAERFQHLYGASILLVGTAAERALADRIAASLRRAAINLAGETSTAELAAVLACCQLFVGNDAGAMHVAAAVGLPVVAIFGPTDPEATGPVSPHWRLVQHRVSCSPCFLRYCPIDHRCMRGVSVDDVVTAAADWLAPSR